MRSSESRYRRLFEAAQDGILLLNADTAQIEDANPYLIDMLGYSHAELLGRKLWEVGAFGDIAKSTDMFALLQTVGYARYDDLPLKTKLGALVKVEFVSNAYECDGTRVIQCNIRDITAQRQAEDEVRQLSAEVQAKRSAEAANRAKSAFLANMSHEIRTPLVAITGLAYLIRRAGLAAEQERWLGMLEAASAHLLELINAVLDLSKIESGKLTLEDVQISVPAIAGNVVSLLFERAAARQVRLLVEAQPLPHALRGDAVRLQQALLNYAGNAVKFSQGGTVVLRVVLQEDGASSVLVRFEVQDTGIGIAAETLPRLFNAFEQADNSTTRTHGGTGLGLAIVRQLANLMGGEVGVQSTLGVGSTFWFTARLRKGEAAAAVRQPVTGSAEERLTRDFAGARILLVDDEATSREVTRELLCSATMDVEVALDGAEAVRMMHAGMHELVLMDVQMPRMDGLEATRQIRLLPGHAGTPIIGLTANAFDADRARCIEAGMDDFLAKPFRPELLFEMLARWLARAARA